MTYYVGNIPAVPTDIQHFGIKGMHWGIRRFQNEDGSYTSAGRSRYGIGNVRDALRSRFGRREEAGLFTSQRRSRPNAIATAVKSRAKNAMRDAGSLVRAAREQHAANKLHKSLLDTASNMKKGIFDSLDATKRHTQWQDEREAKKMGIFGSGLDKFVKNFGSMSASQIDEVFDREKREKSINNLLNKIGSFDVNSFSSAKARSTIGRGHNFVTGLFKSEVRTELGQNRMTVNRNDRQWDDPRYRGNRRIGYAW